MSSYLPKPTDDLSRDIIKVVRGRTAASTDYVRDKYSEAKTWWDAFYGIYTGKVANYMNDITLPLAFSTVMASVARKVNSIYGAWPIVSLHGFPPGSEGIAKKNELLINLQMKECDSFRKALIFFMQSEICGTAVGEVGWSFIKRMRQFRTYVPGTAEIIEVRDLVTEFDGPDWRPLDLPYFLPQANRTHVKDMAHYSVINYMDFDDILELNSADGLQSFDPAAIKALAETRMPTPGGPLEDFMTYTRFNTFDQWMQGGRQNFDKPVKITEHRGLMPLELCPDGVRSRVITIGNDEVVLRNEPDKLLLNGPRIIHYSPTPDPNHFVGIGKARIMEPMQAAASRLISQNLDTLDLSNKQAFIAAAGAVGTQNMHVKPGKIFQVNTKGKNISEVIMPVPVNLQPFEAAFRGMAFLDAMGQKGTGIDEQSIMGMTGAGQNEMTARQYLGMTEAATTRLALEAQLASAEVVERKAELFRDMNKTMLPLPKQFSMLGTRTVLNYITGMPNPPEEGIISMPMELNHGWQAKAFGPTFMLTQSAQRADALQLITTMQANPVFIQITNWIAMARKLYSIFNWDADEMILGMPQMQMMAQQMGMSPQGLLGASDENSMAPFGGAGGQSMAPVQGGTEASDNAPLGPGA